MSTTKEILHEIADPTRTLPDVELIFAGQNLDHDQDFYTAYTDGEEVGQIKLGSINKAEPFVVQGAGVERKKQGYGLAMYLGAAALAYDNGYLLTSDIEVSRDAARLWARLQNRGLARIWEPFQWRNMKQYSSKGRAKFVPFDQLADLLPTQPRENHDDIWDTL